MIKTLSSNNLGRDFVCGDIHGSYSCVERFLSEIGFDKEKDRLICAGDLIDRGPDNEKCLEYLYEPWFHCAMGNHEKLMVGFFTNSPLEKYWWAPNGGAWGIMHANDPSDESAFVRHTAIEVMSKLPILITVEKKGGGKFHVMHAELWSKTPLSDEDFSNEDKFLSLASLQTENGETILWGRHRFFRFYKRFIDAALINKAKREVTMTKMDAMFGSNLSHIYSGHTPVRQPIQFYGQTNLDTMAYASYDEDAPEWAGLTVTEPETGKFWFINDKTFKETSPVIIDDSTKAPIMTLVDNHNAD